MKEKIKNIRENNMGIIIAGLFGIILCLFINLMFSIKENKTVDKMICSDCELWKQIEKYCNDWVNKWVWTQEKEKYNMICWLYRPYNAHDENVDPKKLSKDDQDRYYLDLKMEKQFILEYVKDNYLK